MTHFTIHDNTKIAYSVLGKGFPIVFIHGFCEDRSMWNDFIQPFSKKYQVITIDIGGFGETELATSVTIEGMAEQINAVLVTEKIEKCVFVGHSMGGYVGTAFAELFTKKLEGLCLFHTHPFGDTPAKKINRDRGVKFIERYGIEKYITAMLSMLFPSDYKLAFETVVQKLIIAACKSNVDTIINGLMAMKNRKNSSTILTKINCPVQFIIGKQDAVITWQQSLKQTSLPNIADIRIFEDVGHMGMFEATERTQQAVLEFVLMCASYSLNKVDEIRLQVIR